MRSPLNFQLVGGVSANEAGLRMIAMTLGTVTGSFVGGQLITKYGRYRIFPLLGTSSAALACFVRQGIAATSLRDIAAEAGVTPALLHYYFGDKPQLQEALVQQRLLPAFMTVRSRLAAAGDDLADTIAAFICGVTEAIKQHP